jgi:hypothetical protein
LIDLHTHTTASDGLCSPAELVERAAAAGVRVLSATDHDTTAAMAPAAAAAARAGIQLVPGIEITAVVEGADVHVLGYFLQPESPSLERFLSEQRRRRLERVREMIGRLASHGIELDPGAILDPGEGDAGKAAGRPWIARALVANGSVASMDEAFDRWLGRGRPAFVPRGGASPEEVIHRIHEAGGTASLAHPLHVNHDEWIAAFADAGLDALEAFHRDHGPPATTRYLALAGRLGLAVSGGSDFHGDDGHASEPGSVSLPVEAFDALKARRPYARR